MKDFNRWLQFEYSEGGGDPTPDPEPTPNPEPEKKYTDADVDKLIKEKKAKWQKQKEEELAEAARVAKLDAQQKAEYERDKLQSELDALRAANTRNELKGLARNVLAESGVSVSDALIESCIGKDEDATKENANNLAKAFSSAVDSAVKDRLNGKTPEGTKGGGSPKLTKEDILKIKNPELRQKAMLENRELFGF